MGRLFKLNAVSQIAQIDSEDESVGSKMMWSDKVYWQVADTRAKGSEGLVSSRSTQLGKEDFYIVVIVPTCATVVQGMMMNLITYL